MKKPPQLPVTLPAEHISDAHEDTVEVLCSLPQGHQAARAMSHIRAAAVPWDQEGGGSRELTVLVTIPA